MGYILLILTAALIGDIIVIIFSIHQSKRHEKKVTWSKEERDEETDFGFDERDIYADNAKSLSRSYWDLN